MLSIASIVAASLLATFDDRTRRRPKNKGIQVIVYGKALVVSTLGIPAGVGVTPPFHLRELVRKLVR